jgi:hypothetical protein
MYEFLVSRMRATSLTHILISTIFIAHY